LFSVICQPAAAYTAICAFAKIPLENISHRKLERLVTDRKLVARGCCHRNHKARS
jgi:hypothetical protein